jgi:hypothetical protein
MIIKVIWGNHPNGVTSNVFFLQAVVHGAISLSSAVVDGETHRGKLMSPEIWERIEEFLNFTTDGASGTFLLFEP